MGIPTTIDPGKKPHELYDGVDYRDYWLGVQKASLDKLEHAIVEELLPISSHRFIEVGCGYGRLADCYLDRYKQVVMLDGSLPLLSQARDRTRGQAVYVAGDANRPPFRTASFDIALMVRVFHHLPDARGSLLEMHRILGQEGNLIFSYRNKRDLLRMMKWLLRKLPYNPFCLEPEGIETTLIMHHPKFIDRVLREAGFSRIEKRGAGVVDKLTGKMGNLGRRMPPGSGLAKPFGRSGMAPWIFCKGIVRDNPPLNQDLTLQDLLICPSCGTGLLADAHTYDCRTCRKSYPILDGIIDLRPN